MSASRGALGALAGGQSPPQHLRGELGAEESYTTYHPKWYRRRVSVWWWLHKAPYAKFALRELTSVAVAFFALLCLFEVRALAKGPEAYARFMARLKSPVFIALDVIALLFVMFHAWTWFNLAPKAMVVRVGGKRAPDSVITGFNYLAWFVASGLIAWVLLRSR
jgi:fumarate reductase subunit C